jgi:hypothetical protein
LICTSQDPPSPYRAVDLRQEATRVEFFDIAAVVHFLRKVVPIGALSSAISVTLTLR